MFKFNPKLSFLYVFVQLCTNSNLDQSTHTDKKLSFSSVDCSIGRFMSSPLSDWSNVRFSKGRIPLNKLFTLLHGNFINPGFHTVSCYESHFRIFSVSWVISERLSFSFSALFLFDVKFYFNYFLPLLLLT